MIVIIGLLAGYVAPRYFSQVGKSETQVARAQIDALEKALDQYRLEHRRYPTAEEGLAAIGPYLKKALPNDPWGRPYVYRVPGQRGEFEVFSYGRDGKSGGTGEDADIGLVYRSLSQQVSHARARHGARQCLATREHAGFLRRRRRRRR